MRSHAQDDQQIFEARFNGHWRQIGRANLSAYHDNAEAISAEFERYARSRGADIERIPIHADFIAEAMREDRLRASAYALFADLDKHLPGWRDNMPDHLKEPGDAY